jgi:hypothetical protein
MGRLEKEKKARQKVINANYSTISKQKELEGKTKIGVFAVIESADNVIPYKLVTERESYEMIGNTPTSLVKEDIIKSIGAGYCALRDLEQGRDRIGVSLADVNQFLAHHLIMFCWCIDKEEKLSEYYQKDEFGFSLSFSVDILNNTGDFDICEMTDHLVAPFDSWDKVSTTLTDKIGRHNKFDKNINKSFQFS